MAGLPVRDPAVDRSLRSVFGERISVAPLRAGRDVPCGPQRSGCRGGRAASPLSFDAAALVYSWANRLPPSPPRHLGLQGIGDFPQCGSGS